MQGIAKVIFAVLTALYPLGVFFALLYFKASAHLLILGLLFLAIVLFVVRLKPGQMTFFEKLQSAVLVTVLTGLLALAVATDQVGLAKFYPVIMNLFLLSGFAFTLFRGPTMVFKFATLQDQSILGSPDEDKVRAYCRSVTVVWCCFFVFGAVAAWVTTVFFSDFVWTLWNGLISYVLVGGLLLGEFLVRRRLMGR